MYNVFSLQNEDYLDALVYIYYKVLTVKCVILHKHQNKKNVLTLITAEWTFAIIVYIC